MGDTLEQIIGVLNGAVGDYLKRTDNGLATPMTLVDQGEPLALSREALAGAIPDPRPRAVLFVHGLMSVEVVWRMHGGESYGDLFQRHLGITPLYLRYNSGLHVSENGEQLDALLEELVACYPAPLEELLLVGHSMGGLVVRSAAHFASARERRWLPLVKRAIYLGTPHHGAPLERFGNVLSWVLGTVGRTLDEPYTRLVADIVNMRSSGIKDLRYGSLRHEDWLGADADALLENRRHPVPLLPHIRHHLVAGTLTDDPVITMLFGDALVSLRSASGRARPADRSAPFPQSHVRVLSGRDHLRLAHDPEVFDQMRAWCEEDDGCNVGAA